MAKKSLVQAARRRFKGKYAGPDKYKGKIPEGYKGKAKGKYFGKDSRKGANYSLLGKSPSKPKSKVKPGTIVETPENAAWHQGPKEPGKVYAMAKSPSTMRLKTAEQRQAGINRLSDAQKKAISDYKAAKASQTGPTA